MSNTSSPFLFVSKPCDDAVLWAVRKLEASGLQAVCTFDLQVARLATHLDCSCPHHGTEQCDCQMVMILVYKGQQNPVTLIAHGHDQMSWFTMANEPSQPFEPRPEKMIQDVLTAL